MLTTRQRAVLAHVVLDPDAWLAHAESVFGEDRAAELMRQKVERWTPDYNAVKARQGASYRRRANRSISAPGS